MCPTSPSKARLAARCAALTPLVRPLCAFQLFNNSSKLLLLFAHTMQIWLVAEGAAMTPNETIRLLGMDRDRWGQLQTPYCGGSSARFLHIAPQSTHAICMGAPAFLTCSSHCIAAIAGPSLCSAQGVQFMRHLVLETVKLHHHGGKLTPRANRHLPVRVGRAGKGGVASPALEPHVSRLMHLCSYQMLHAHL